MLNKVIAGIKSFFGSSGRWMPIVVVILICLGLISYTNTKVGYTDNMYSPSDYNQSSQQTQGPSQNASANQAQILPQKMQTSDSDNSGYALQPVANPADLLPNDQNSQWAALNPINNGNIQTPDLLQAGYHIGLDTIGQTLKNANLQLRSDPIIEKRDVGPWNNSTYEADYGRVPLEVGNK
jgi:hypothetical protein